MVINGAIVSDLDMMYLESVLQVSFLWTPTSSTFVRLLLLFSFFVAKQLNMKSCGT